MQIPQQVKIGSQDVKVTLTPRAHIDSDCNGGWAKWEDNEMMIASDMPQQKIEYTFFHEALHFINVYLTEEQCTYIAEGMYAFLSDNNLLK